MNFDTRKQLATSILEKLLTNQPEFTTTIELRLKGSIATAEYSNSGDPVAELTDALQWVRDMPHFKNMLPNGEWGRAQENCPADEYPAEHIVFPWLQSSAKEAVEFTTRMAQRAGWQRSILRPAGASS